MTNTDPTQNPNLGQNPNPNISTPPFQPASYQNNSPVATPSPYQPNQESLGQMQAVQNPNQPQFQPQPNFNNPVQFQQAQFQQPAQPVNPQAYNPADPNYYNNSNSAFDLGFGNNPAQAPVQNAAGPNIFNKLGGQLKTASNNKAFDGLKKNWWIALSGGILFVLLIVAAWFTFAGSSTPPSNFTNVIGKISSDARVPSGSLGTWKINIDNRENTTLDKVKLFLKFDRTFTFSRSLLNTPDAAQEGFPYGSIYTLGQLKPLGIGGSSALVTIEGTLIGDLDTEAITEGYLEYQPVGASRMYRIELEKAVTKIGAPELTIDLTAPTSVKNGSESDLFVDFKNSSDRSLSNLRIKLNYPVGNGFKYISSQLQLSKTSDVKTQPDEGDNIWLINELPRFTNQQLKVRGQFVGVAGELKKLEAEISARNNQTGDYQILAKKAISVTITGETLQVRAYIDGREDYRFFGPGENVTLKVAYKNTSTRNLEDVKVLAWMDDPANILDLTTISFTGGDRGNYNNGKLEWRQQGAPQLRLIPPNGSGELSFNVKVKDGKNFLNGKPQTQFTLRPRALINAIATEDVAVVGDEYRALGELKFNAKIERQTRIQPNRNDPNLPEIDFSRLQVGVPASYVVTWTLTNSQNQVNRVKVSTKSELPPTVWDQTTVLPVTENAKITFDKVTGDIVWDAGDLPGYTGIVLPAKTVSFVLTFTPSEPDLVSGVNLYKDVKIEGVDDFTSQVYQLKAGGEGVR